MTSQASSRSWGWDKERVREGWGVQWKILDVTEALDTNNSTVGYTAHAHTQPLAASAGQILTSPLIYDPKFSSIKDGLKLNPRECNSSIETTQQCLPHPACGDTCSKNNI